MKRFCIVLLLGLGLGMPAVGQEWLDRVDEALSVQSRNGWFGADLGGLLDLETYYIDGHPPGLIFSDDDLFFNPRLSLHLDAQFGSHLYAFAQARVDRGFDPGIEPEGDARLDEYFARYTPFSEPTLNLQAGKFATVVGSWVRRHDSWSNPFINAPIPYENVTTITDQAAPPGPAGFLARKVRPDQKGIWLPIVWGPSYTSGGSVFGALGKFDYAVEVKNAALSSRHAAWDGTDLGWEYPTWSGRLGIRPNAAWNLGLSASHGTYLLPAARPTLPASSSRGDFAQTTLAHDASFAWRHWQLWGEVFLSRFEVPNVGDADTLAYYVEARYKIRPRLSGAIRWNQQFFGDVTDAAGREVAWDRDLWRADAALAYRFNPHWQTKLQYSYTHERGALQQGEQLVAAQLTLKF